MYSTFHKWRGSLWLAPAVLVLAAFVYLPLAQNFGYSTQRSNIFTGESEFIGMRNFEVLLNDPIFWRSLFNNVLYAIVSVICQVGGALVVAAGVESVRSSRLRNALRVTYFIPSAISITVAGLLFYFIYEPNIGILNSALTAIGLEQWVKPWLGQQSTAMLSIILMSQWQGFGYTALLFTVAIQRIPTELFEAAQLDGIGPIRRFITITVPLVRQMSGLLTIVTISGAFQVFNEVMVMTSGGPSNSTQVLGTWLYRNGFVRNDFGYAAAIATVIFIVTLGIGLFQLWYTRKRKVEL